MAFVEPYEKFWVATAEQVEGSGLSLYDVEKISPSKIRVFIEKLYPPAVLGTASLKKEEHPDPVSPGAVLQDVTEFSDASQYSEGGVTSGDCSLLCRKLRVFFEVHGEAFGLGSDLEIEVSSPGVNRHLRLLTHFQQAIGKRVKVVMFIDETGSCGSQQQHTEARMTKAVVGTLSKIEEDELTLFDEQSKQEVSILLPNIKKAQIDFLFPGVEEKRRSNQGKRKITTQ